MCWYRSRPALATLIALALAPATFATSEEVNLRIAPASPFEHDPVTLTVAGVWRDSCTPSFGGLVRVPAFFSLPTGIPLAFDELWTVVLFTPGEGCATVLTPFEERVALGELSPGTHEVTVFVVEAVLDPEPEPRQLGEVRLTVSPGYRDHLELAESLRVAVSWEDAAGRAGEGFAVPGSSDSSGLLWFFDPGNWELLVKVLDGCSFNGHRWVLLAGATDVAFEVRILADGGEALWRYSHPLGAPVTAQLDIEAIPCATP